jgi:hypothetical protein
MISIRIGDIGRLLRRSLRGRAEEVSNHNLYQLAACASLFAFLCIRTMVYQYITNGKPGFVDDAYYYFVVAKHIFMGGGSSFDGHTLTNGYHPLWVLVLVGQYKFFGSSLLVTRILEVLLGEAALLTSLAAARFKTFAAKLVFTVGFFWILSRIGLNGMETTLLAATFCMYTLAVNRRCKEGIYAGLVDGLLAAAIVASRLDAAVFVLPLILCAERSWARRVAALFVLGSCLVCYAWFNVRVFGLAMPVSGEVKSLGGFQVNQALLHFLLAAQEPSAILFYPILVLFLSGLILMKWRGWEGDRAMLIAFVVGFFVFSIRLFFFSSWVIWTWYDYPLLIGYLAVAPALITFFESSLVRMARQRVLVTSLAALLVIASMTHWIHFVHKSSRNSVQMANDHLALAGAVASLKGEPVAMGDLAGAFAYAYNGRVDQIEGIMNDKTYLNVLRHKSDVKSLLCQRDVRFILAYEPDLGSYKEHLVNTIRPELSQYAAPHLEVTKQDEIFRLTQSFSGAGGPGSHRAYLYGWRLACEKTAQVAAF